ncbi:MAG: heavy metal translocating P-type ATPase [Termitinemataceae bacterium]|nr:MAG: heavy metal translocating P-type ATPase [Termitinemataceae bacterium]
MEKEKKLNRTVMESEGQPRCGSCCCERCTNLQHGDIKKNEHYKAGIICFGIGVLFFILGALLSFEIISFDIIPAQHNAALIVCLFSYLLIAYPIIISVLKNISRGIIFDENFLMTVATCGAFAIGEYPEGVAVILFYRIGEAFEEAAVGKSKKSITSLLNIRADYVQLKIDGELKKVKPEDVPVGSTIVVAPGEKIPLDGLIETGASSLDTSALTGETMPRDVGEGNVVVSGSLNLNGLLTIRTTKTAGDSTVTKILDLVENSQSRKTQAENFITKFAKYYTPVVVISAALLAIVPPLIISGADFADWIHRALIFLVVSCPCALVISIPLSFFAGIGAASKKGILIKGGNYLEALNKIDSIIFDKTGTLTTGKFKVENIKTYGKYSSDDILFYCAHIEHFSKHPAAISICAEYTSPSVSDKRTVDTNIIENLHEIPGFGVSALVNGKNILAGNKKLMLSKNITAETNADGMQISMDENGLVVYVAIDNELAGCIKLSDELKASSKDSIAFIKRSGINVMILSGDTNDQVKEFAALAGIENYASDLLPQDKLQILEKTILSAKNKNTRRRAPHYFCSTEDLHSGFNAACNSAVPRTRNTLRADSIKPYGANNVVFVGDGINDAPALARSDIGIAIGAFGSDAAIEAADVVLMNGEPESLCTVINIAKKTHSIVRQNIVFALAVKAAILALGALGLASIWLAVFGDVGVAFIAVLNSIRNLRYTNS